MRINELLENTLFNDLDFVSPKEDGREINYDLPDDLIHFMHNDDNVYRRHVYPAISKCVDRVKADRATHPNMFKVPVETSYKLYIKKFPIRELPDDLEEEVCKKVCKKIHDDTCKHVADGKYKD